MKTNYPKNFKKDSIQSVILPKLKKLKMRTQIIKIMSINDITDHML